MSRRRYNWLEGVGHLRENCDRLAGFIDAFGKRRLPIRNEGSLFSALARAIAYQQLSGKAAATIHGRFLQLFPGGEATPGRTIRLSHEQLRSVGLSRAKSLSIRDLAERSLGGQLPTPRQMGSMSDDEIIESLCTVRGIGPWTAQMYLIFNLGRPDVMPSTDLGVQKGVQNIYRMRTLPKPAFVERKTRRLAPYRSVASWYFWRASEAQWAAVLAEPGTGGA